MIVEARPDLAVRLVLPVRRQPRLGMRGDLLSKDLTKEVLEAASMP